MIIDTSYTTKQARVSAEFRETKTNRRFRRCTVVGEHLAVVRANVWNQIQSSD